MIQLLIFDLDGTLFSTERANYTAYRQAFATVGVQLERDAYRACFGLAFPAMVQKVAPQLGPTEVAEVKRAKAEFYRQALHEVVPNLPLIGFLRSVKGVQRTALATTASRQNAEAVLRHFDLLDAFDDAVFGDEISRTKPDPECFHALIERAGLTPADCLIFEDSPVGLAAAEASGARVLRVVCP